VLFVGGSGKSGSTLLGSLLGRRSGLFNGGEMNLFWGKWLDPGERCGCGTRLDECPFWSAVVAEVGAAGVEPQRMAELAARLDHTRRLGRVLSRRLSGTVSGEWAELAAGTGALYRAAFRHSGASWLVDLSKIPTHLLLLRELRDAELRILHLIRDGRAVAYSWERKRRRAKAGGSEGDGMYRHPSVAADMGIWLVQNFAIDSIARRVDHSTRLKYETLTAAPGDELSAALRRIGMAAAEASDADGTSEAWDHAVGGNDRVRFAPAGTAITPDEAWRRELSPWQIRLWSALALPGLRRFGYRL
jgi:hypothetical protein